MTIKLTKDNQEFILKASNEDDFFSQLKVLPAGEYAVENLSKARRSGKRSRKPINIRKVQLVAVALEVACILGWFISLIALWIILAAIA